MNDKAPGSGKAALKTAEEAYDKLAAEHGIDEHGDELPDAFEDDEPAGEELDTVAEDESAQDDEPYSEEQEEIEPEETPEEGQEARGSEEEPHSELPDPPHAWREEWKREYNKITDPAVRKIINELNGYMNKAFSQRMTEVAQLKRDMGGVKGAITPHANRLARAGISPEVAVSRALGWDQYIQQDPEKGWLDYGKALGINTEQVLQNQQQASQQQYMTPTERAIKEQNEQLAARIQAQEQNYARWEQQNAQADATQRQAQATNMLVEFMNAKDEAGNQLHPNVEMVAPMMTRLIQNGVTSDLREAYMMAAANNPDLARARENTRKAQQVRESQRKAEKVRKASRSGIVGKGSTRGNPKAKRSTADQVSAAYDKIANG